MKFDLLKKYVEQCHELGKEVTFKGLYHYKMAFK
ncbi:hypothetical protein BJV41_003119 [Clostridium beijerinckii]|nr:hypothetical protein [Clostridium beijerinckii]